MCGGMCIGSRQKVSIQDFKNVIDKSEENEVFRKLLSIDVSDARKAGKIKPQGRDYGWLGWNY